MKRRYIAIMAVTILLTAWQYHLALDQIADYHSKYDTERP